MLLQSKRVRFYAKYVLNTFTERLNYTNDMYSYFYYAHP